MRLLHISDLHVTRPFKSLEEVWLGPAKHLAHASFDAVIVSGDLSQRASQKEYERLEEFLRLKVLPLCREPDPARVVLIPGNHDVDWTAHTVKDRPVDDLIAERGYPGLKEVLRETRNLGGASDYRWAFSARGNLLLYQIDPDAYAARFRNCAQFFKNFYTGSSKILLKPADLLSEADDWSCHFFEEHGIAIYGFNSCFRNDRFWFGAAIDPRSVERASSFAAENTPEAFRAAVWHHGLGGDGFREDHLRLVDVGALYNAGFVIGFHGHTHRAGQRELDAVLGERFAVVSTGSIGAGPKERPDAVGNQFSIADLYPSYVRVKRFQRDGEAGLFRESPGWTYRFSRPSGSPREVTAERHLRFYAVSEGGKVEVRVELENVRATGTLVLAVLTPPFCDFSYDQDVQTDVGPHPVDRRRLPDGRVRFSVATLGEAERLKWSYRVSNSLPLTSRELNLMDNPSPWYPDLSEQGQFARPHTVRFPVRTLEVRYAFATKVEPASRGPIVERPRKDDATVRQWERSREECRRCTPAVSTDGFGYTIEGPNVGHRLSYPYKPSAGMRSLTSGEQGFCNRLLALTRGEAGSEGDDSGPSLVTLLRKAMEAGLNDLLADSTGLYWHGFLWSEGARRLLTSFGHLPPGYWGIRFAPGYGVTGHCFRFGRPAAWYRSEDASLIYQRMPEGQDAPTQHQWIVALALVTERDGPAVGVVSFENQGDLNVCPQLGDLANAAAGESPATSVEDALLTLQAKVNALFWGVLANSDGLTQTDQTLATMVLNRLTPK